MAKKAKKSKAKKSRPVSDKTLEKILVECALSVGQGVGSGTKISDDARKLWHSRFRKSIKRALAAGERWAQARLIVVPLARKMGARAASLAAPGPIGKSHAKQAADEISIDKACPPGQGKFCN
jgi:hypothetical protein